MSNYFFKYFLKNTLVKVIAIAFITLNSSNFYAQTNVQDFTVPPKVGFRCRAEVVNGDTLPLVNLSTVYVYTDFVFKNQRQYELWTRTKYNVKKVYPYAILAAAKLKEYDKAMEKMTDENLKKAFLKVCEKDLRKEFEGELKELSISQGKVLMKLIDRETGKTTYDLVKQLRGGFQAAMWQTVACIFGHNMKTEYDANVEDIMIERAIKLVENGQF
jgi:hypothetical protein